MRRISNFNVEHVRDKRALKSTGFSLLVRRCIGRSLVSSFSIKPNKSQSVSASSGVGQTSHGSDVARGEATKKHVRTFLRNLVASCATTSRRACIGYLPGALRKIGRSQLLEFLSKTIGAKVSQSTQNMHFAQARS